MWLKVIFSLLLNKFCLTCLLPLPTTTFLRNEMGFWDVLSMKKKWAFIFRSALWSGKNCPEIIIFSIIAFCLVVFEQLSSQLYLIQDAWGGKRSLKFYVQRAPRFISFYRVWIAWVWGAALHPSCLALPRIHCHCWPVSLVWGELQEAGSCCCCLLPAAKLQAVSVHSEWEAFLGPWPLMHLG